MARTKDFDPAEALDRAMEVFWRHGYENTSLDQLLDAMRIARQSLYDTFGDKRALYLRALAHYRDRNHSDLRRLLGADRPVKEGFAKLLLGLAGESREEHERGCLLLSANLQRAAGDEQVAELLRANQDAVQAIFTEALLRAQLRGQLSRKKDAAALARFLVVTIQGMRSFARLQSDRKALVEIARVALAALD